MSARALPRAPLARPAFGLLLLSLLGLLIACTDVNPTNPYDPATPESQQARGRLTGAVVLPTGYTASTFDGATVEVRRADHPAEVAATAPLTPDAEATPPRARFTVTDLTAGVYLVAIALPGLAVPVQTVEVPRGGAVELGDLAASTAGGAFVEGVATLAGAGITSHAGILVTAPGTPAAALTAESGAFRLEVPPGEHTLRATYAGYAPAASAPLDVRPQQTTTLPEPLVLTGQPGAVTGRVRLLGGYAQERVAEAVVVLQTADGAEAARTTVSPDGRFRLDPVDAGEYVLAAGVEGFSAPARPLTLTVGEVVDLGEVLLAPAEEGELTGMVTLQGALSHEGTVVSLTGTPATAVTGPDGAFRLSVAAGSYRLHLQHRGYTAPATREVTITAGARTALEAAYEMNGAPGSLEGTVGLPEGFDTEGVLLTVSVIVRRDGEVEDAGVGTPTPEGRILFEGLPAGSYRIFLRLPGFVEGQASAVVPLGERVSFGHVTLQPAASDTALVGEAQLQGADNHGGITVSTDGLPYQASTTPEGRYRLAVPARPDGSYRLTFQKAGYGNGHAVVSPVPAGEVTVAETPILVGQPGRISGLVELDDRFADPGLMPRVSIRLERLEDGVRQRVAQTVPDADGVFVFDALDPATYYLFAVLEGFVDARAVLPLAVGEDVMAPVLYLTPDAASQAATIVGRVEREGRGPGEHGGIRVEAALSGYVALTSADGDFELNVVAGTYTLAFHADGYGGDTSAPIDLAAGARVSLPETVLLHAQPGAVRGAVSVPEGFDAEGRVDRVQLTLTRPGDGEPFAVTSPAPDGSFFVSDVPAGTWSLSATLPGFSATPVLLDLAPGELEDVHLIALTLAAREEAALPLIRGHVSLLGAGPQGHGGVVVEVQGTPFSTLSRSDGAFEVVATPGPATLLLTRDRYVPLTWGPLHVGDADLVLPDPLEMIGEPGRVRGVVQLPPGFAAEDAADVAVEVTRDGETVALVAPDAAGLFVADALPAADYRIEFTLAGFLPITLPASVSAGQTTDLGVVALAQAPSTAGLTGTARLQGVLDNAGGHGGIRVEAVGTPFTAVTAGDGSFRLAVQPRALTLAFRREGYGTQTAVVPAPPAGVDTPLANVVVLPALPGRVHGTVTLSRFGTVDRLRAVAVALINAQNAPVAQASPAADGQFVLPDIAAGDYSLRVTGTGYETATLGVTVPVGAQVEIGHVDLTHKSAGPSAVVFAGRLTLTGAADHGGTAVRLRTANPDQAFTATQTDAEGRFEVLAAPDETYRLAAHHAGYDDPALPATWRWDAVERRFEDENAAPLDLALAPSPLNGRVEVSLRIAPDWLPVEQQYMRVRLRGGTYEQNAPQVTEAAPQVFNNVPAGSYVLSIERPGFTSVQVPLSLDLAHPSVTVGPVDVTLVNLAAAQIDLSGRQLDACALRRAPVNFRGADLSGVRFTGDLSAAGGAACGGCSVCGAFDLSGTNLTNADFTGATSLAGVDFSMAVLFGARAAGARLDGANLNGANLFGADLSGAALGRTDLRGANLTSASLAGASFVAAGEALPTNPCDPNAARPAVRVAGAVFTQADMTGANLRGVDFSAATLSNGRLQGAQLQQACLRDADLTLINLAGANFDGADAAGAQFTSAILNHTSLRGAELTQAVLTNAVIQDADMRPKPLANGQACTPYPWEVGRVTEAACTGPTRWTDPRCCRTQLDGANLNGANLVGARMDDVDLSDASLLGITVGDSDEPPDAQPADCHPERYNACLDACAVINACEMNVRQTLLMQLHTDLDCEAWAELCVRGVLDIGDQRFSVPVDDPMANCLADAYAAGGCGTLVDGASVCGTGMSPFQPRGAACTWAQLEADTCPTDDVEPAVCQSRATSLMGARLDGAQLTAVTLSRLHLKGALARGASLRGAFVVDTLFEGADMTGTDFGRSELSGADLSSMLLDSANFQQANLTFTALSGARLTGANFDDADLRSALLIGATADTPDNGVPAISARRADLRHADLTDASLPGINLRDADLRDARLRGARFPGADLMNVLLTPGSTLCVDLTDTKLVDLNLAQSRVSYLDFDGARVTGLDFRGSEVLSSRFDHTYMRQVTFAGAQIYGFNVPPAGYTPLASITCTGDPMALDLFAVTFAGARLEQVDFTDVLMGANLNDATLVVSDIVRGGPGEGRIDGTLMQRTGLYQMQIGFANAYTPADADLYDASRVDFTDACLIGATFRYTRLDDARFVGTVTPRAAPASAVCQRACTDADGTPNQSCNLLATQCQNGQANCAVFDHPHLDRVAFTNAYLSPARFTAPTGANITLTSSDFNRMTMTTPALTGVTATDATFNNAVITDGEIRNSTFTRPNFRSARLSGVNLSGTNMSGADFNGATFTACNMGGQFTSNGARRPDFTGVSFYEAGLSRRADLAGVDFVNAILRNANLTQAWLFGALFDGVVNRVDMTGANLTQANLNSATFRNVDLIGADVRACNFQAATWNNVNFTNATMCLADYNYLTANLALRCPGCNLTNVTRPACALTCNQVDPCP